GDPGLIQQGRTYREVAVQVDVRLQCGGHFAHGRGWRFRALGILPAFLLAPLARFLAREIALMEGDLAALRHGDEHLAALFLGSLLMLPRLEDIALVEDYDLAPAGGEVGLLPHRDGETLLLPEEFEILEAAVLAEQVGDDLTGVGLKRKQ